MYALPFSKTPSKNPKQMHYWPTFFFLIRSTEKDLVINLSAHERVRQLTLGRLSGPTYIQFRAISNDAWYNRPRIAVLDRIGTLKCL